jgi:hypothetical protein
VHQKLTNSHKIMQALRSDLKPELADDEIADTDVSKKLPYIDSTSKIDSTYYLAAFTHKITDSEQYVYQDTTR